MKKIILSSWFALIRASMMKRQKTWSIAGSGLITILCFLLLLLFRKYSMSDSILISLAEGLIFLWIFSSTWDTDEYIFLTNLNLRTMPKLFFPKMTGLSEKDVNEKMSMLLNKYPFLNSGDIENIKYYSNHNSPYGGTIIDKDATFTCYPYDRDSEGFKEEYPDGEVIK